MAHEPTTTSGTQENRVERLLVVSALMFFAAVYATAIARTTFRHDGHLVGTLFDDALISLRYAQNLIAGYGLVWNPGEQPPVEGYTNLGWTLIMSLVAWVLPADAAPIGMSAVAALLLLASGVTAWSLLRTVGAGAPARLSGMLLVLACYPTVFWSLRGMEVGLLSLLLLLAVRVTLTHPGTRPARTLLLTSAIGGFAILTRNDAVLLFVPVLAWATWRRGGLRRALPAALPLTIAIAAQIAFRYAYYGAWVPNTYVLKMTGVSFDIRLAAGIMAMVDTLAPIACAAALVGLAALAPTVSTRVRDLALLTLVLLVSQCAYLVYVGGDAWVIDYSNRFVATIMPVLLVAAAAALPAGLTWIAQSRPVTALFVAGNVLVLLGVGLLHPRMVGPDSHWMILAGWIVLIGASTAPAVWSLSAARMRVLTAASVVALFLLSSAHGWVNWTRWNAAKAPDDVAFARLGLMFREQLPADAVIALDWLGAPAYFSGRTAIDLLGKTDPHVARAPAGGTFRPGHNKMDPAYSIGRLRPDIVRLDDARVAGYGYDRMANGLWVRRNSPAASMRHALGSSWCPEAMASVYCPRESVASR